MEPMTPEQAIARVAEMRAELEELRELRALVLRWAVRHRSFWTTADYRTPTPPGASRIALREAERELVARVLDR